MSLELYESKKILDIHGDFDIETLKKHYIKQIKKYHPDTRKEGTDKNIKAEDIIAAYDYLKTNFESFQPQFFEIENSFKEKYKKHNQMLATNRLKEVVYLHNESILEKYWL
ncbi:MAG: DnaJ domain-containing protein, partial [Mycoplasma sp.]